MNRPTLPGACDRDSHQWCSSPCSRRSRSVVEGRRRRRRSGGCRPPGRSRSACTTCASPKRVTAVSQNAPGLVSGASFLPAHLGGIGSSTRQTLPLGSIHSCGCSSAGSRRRMHLVGRPRRRWRRWGCRAAGRSARAAGRRCGRRRARCRSSPGRCGRARMLELSPLVTAATAPALLDAGLDEVVAVEAEADDLLPAEVLAGGARKASAFLSMTATVWPTASRLHGELAAHPPASDDDDVHRTPSCSGPAACYRGRRGARHR